MRYTSTPKPYRVVSGEVATTHVTEVAAYFHYCRKVTLCLNGKSPNYNFTTQCRQAHIETGEFNLRNNICNGSWKFCAVQRGIGARAGEVGAFKSALRSRRTPAFGDRQSDYCRPVNPVLSLCTVSCTV